MKHSDFVHLHNHSDYSLLDGASAIPAMVKKAAKLNMPALALTDHGAMFGAVEFYNDAKKAGVKPIVGMEAYVTRNGRASRSISYIRAETSVPFDELTLHALRQGGFIR